MQRERDVGRDPDMEPVRVVLLHRPVHGRLGAVEGHADQVILIRLDRGPKVHDEGGLVAGHADRQERDGGELRRRAAEEARRDEDQDDEREDREDHAPAHPHLPLHAGREGSLRNKTSSLLRERTHAASGPNRKIEASPKSAALTVPARKLVATASIRPLSTTPTIAIAKVAALNMPA